MKKLGLVVAGALIGAASIAQATVTIEIDAGVLRNSTGTAFTQGQGLLQLVALRSATGTFATPTATSFVGGDNANELILASFAFQQGGAGFVAGELDKVVQFNYENSTFGNSTTTFDPGDQLLLRWYPTLTLNSTAPGAATTFGQYRNSATPDGGITWFGPADGSTLGLGAGLNFLTTTAQGSQPETSGFALNVTAVPEPSTVFMLGVGAISAFAFARRRAAKA